MALAPRILHALRGERPQTPEFFPNIPSSFERLRLFLTEQMRMSHITSHSCSRHSLRGEVGHRPAALLAHEAQKVWSSDSGITALPCPMSRLHSARNPLTAKPRKIPQFTIKVLI